MCEFVYAATTLNTQMSKLPLLYNASQKLQNAEFLYAVHQNAKRPYKDIIKFQGFKLGNGDISKYIEMCKRATLEDSDKSS